MPDDGPTHGDTLALTARQHAGLAPEIAGQIQRSGGVRDALLDLGLRGPPLLKAERHVLEDRHMRVERIVLEDHRDVPVPRIGGRDVLVADEQPAGRRALQPGCHPQQG